MVNGVAVRGVERQYDLEGQGVCHFADCCLRALGLLLLGKGWTNTCFVFACLHMPWRFFGYGPECMLQSEAV